MVTNHKAFQMDQIQQWSKSQRSYKPSKFCTFCFESFNTCLKTKLKGRYLFSTMLLL